MRKIKRNLSTPENREFWKRAEEISKEVRTWPDWKRAGINVSQQRESPPDLNAILSEILMLAEHLHDACVADGVYADQDYAIEEGVHLANLILQLDAEIKKGKSIPKRWANDCRISRKF